MERRHRLGDLLDLLGETKACLAYAGLGLLALRGRLALVIIEKLRGERLRGGKRRRLGRFDTFLAKPRELRDPLLHGAERPFREEALGARGVAFGGERLDPSGRPFLRHEQRQKPQEGGKERGGKKNGKCFHDGIIGPLALPCKLGEDASSHEEKHALAESHRHSGFGGGSCLLWPCRHRACRTPPSRRWHRGDRVLCGGGDRLDPAGGAAYPLDGWVQRLDAAGLSAYLASHGPPSDHHRARSTLEAQGKVCPRRHRRGAASHG